jgi:YVTN family beta-propeller protein
MKLKNFFILFLLIQFIFCFGCGGGGGGTGGGGSGNSTYEVQSEVGPNGGIISVDDPNSPLYGVKIEIPKGALAENTIFTITEATLLPSETFLTNANMQIFGTGIKATVSNKDAILDEIYLTIPYADLNDSDLEKSIAIFHSEDESNDYSIIYSGRIISRDIINNTITISLKNLCNLFTGLYKTVVFSDGSSYEYFEHEAFDKGINFLKKIENIQQLYQISNGNDCNEENFELFYKIKDLPDCLSDYTKNDSKQKVENIFGANSLKTFISDVIALGKELNNLEYESNIIKSTIDLAKRVDTTYSLFKKIIDKNYAAAAFKVYLHIVEKSIGEIFNKICNSLDYSYQRYMSFIYMDIEPIGISSANVITDDLIEPSCDLIPLWCTLNLPWVDGVQAKWFEQEISTNANTNNKAKILYNIFRNKGVRPELISWDNILTDHFKNIIDINAPYLFMIKLDEDGLNNLDVGSDIDWPIVDFKNNPDKILVIAKGCGGQMCSDTTVSQLRLKGPSLLVLPIYNLSNLPEVTIELFEDRSLDGNPEQHIQSIPINIGVIQEKISEICSDNLDNNCNGLINDNCNVDPGQIQNFPTDFNNAPIQTGQYSFWTEISPDGAYLFVSNLADDTISVIDTTNNIVIKTIVNNDSTLIRPFGGAIAPDGSKLIIVSQDELYNNLTVYNALPPFQIIRHIWNYVGDGPSDVAFTPNGEFAYVSNMRSNNVSIIRISDYQVISTINVGSYPRYLTITPDGSYVYVANENSPSGVSIINTTTNQVEAFILFESSAFQPVVTPNGEYVYVTAGSHIYVISTATKQIVDDITIQDFNAGPGIGVTPDGEYVYVIGGFTNSIKILRTSDNSVVGTLSNEQLNSPFGIAFTPDGNRAYVTNRGTGTVSIIE